MPHVKRQKIQLKSQVIITALLLVAGLFVFVKTSQAAVGFQVGTSTLILNNAENLIYGNINITSASGSNLMLLQNNSQPKLVLTSFGNLGIGVATPNDIFSIGMGGVSAPAGADRTGHNYASTYLSSDNYALVNYGLVKSLIDTATSSSALWGGTLGGNIWNLNGTNNVGIGTTAPTQKLDVNGLIAVNNIRFNSATKYSTEISNNLLTDNKRNIVFNNIFSAGETLYSGTIRIIARKKDTNAVPNGILEKKMSFHVLGGVVSGLESSVDNVSGGMNAVRIGDPFIDSDMYLKIPISSTGMGSGRNIYFEIIIEGSNTWVSKLSNVSFDASVADTFPGYSYPTISSRLGIGLGNNVMPSQALQVTGSALISGNVGIGTTNPANQLEILKNSAAGSEANNGISILSAAAETKLIMGAISGSYSYIQSMQNGTGWTQRPLVLQGLGGNVGIGAIAPNDVFSIGASGGAAAPAGSDRTGHNNASTYLSSDNYALVNYGLVKSLIDTATSSSALWGGTLGGNIWNLNGTNNVGIGTTNPGYKLEIAGTIRSGGAGVNGTLLLGSSSDGLGGSSISQTAATTLTIAQTRGLGSNIILGGNGIEFQTEDSTSPYTRRTRLIVRHGDSGNVGVGTTNVGAKLDVYGDAKFGSSVTAVRYASFDTSGRLVVNYNDNTTSPVNFINLRNLDVSAGITHLNRINFAFARTGDATERQSGGLMFGKEQEWTATATTNDSYFAIQTSLNATAAEKLRVTSAGNVGIGTTAPNDVFSIGTAGGIAAPAGSDRTGHNNASTYLSSDNYALTNYGLVKTLIDSATSTYTLWGGEISGDIWSLNGTNNVGIGTKSPTAKLEVKDGDIYINNGNLTLNSPINSALVGIIFKGHSSFIHDFNYGYNGTVTTDGNNTFVGINSGNFAMGSAAGATYQASHNTAVGFETLTSNTLGFRNSAFGVSALRANTTGSNNIALGYRSLYANSSGGNNVALGLNAAYSNTIGANIVALGRDALYSNTDGTTNVAIGAAALYNNTTGYSNIALGYNAGSGAVIGSNQDSRRSIYIGENTRASANSAWNEIVIGDSADGIGGDTVVLGNDWVVTTALKGNVGIGTTAPNDAFSIGTTGGTAAPAGSDRTGHNNASTYLSSDNYALVNYGIVKTLINSATSSSALWGGTLGGNIWNLNGTNNVGIGTTTPLAKLTVSAGNIGIDNTTFAAQNGIINKNGSRFIHNFNYGFNGTVTTSGENTFMGYNAGNFTMGATATVASGASFNSAFGSQAFSGNTTGASNSALGSSALRTNTTGDNNVAVGSVSLFWNTTGSSNSAVGKASMQLSTTGSNNSALGDSALYNNTIGSNNSAFGASAMFQNSAGSGGVAFGYQAMYYTNSTTTAWTNSNTGIGFQALRGSTTPSANTGNFNTALGGASLFSNTTGNNNAAVGYNALGFNTAGLNNTALGASALYLLSSGSNNTAVGNLAGTYIANGSTANATASNSIYIGYYASALASGASNEIVIGSGTIGLGSNSVIIGTGSTLKTMLRGNVGINTSAPNDSFSIADSGTAAPAGSANTGHNYASTYINSDNYALANIGYVKSLIQTATSTMSTTTMVSSIFLTTTTSAGTLTYTGGYTGYDAGNKICNAAQAGSHFCRTDEIIYLIQTLGAVGFTSINTQDAWIADGPPGFTGTVSADDCGGWTDSTNNKLGHFWIFASAGGGRGSLSSCDTIKKITCCK